MKLQPRRNGYYGLDLFDDFFDMPSFPHISPRDFMRTDITELDDRYIMDIDLPGYNKDELKIELEKGYLTITASKDETKDDSKGNLIHRERCTGTCTRSYYVGDNIKQEDIKAGFKDGILKVSFPKESKQIEEKKLISIE